MVNKGNSSNPPNISSLGCGIFTFNNASRDAVGLPSEFGQGACLIIRANIDPQNYSTVAFCTEESNKGIFGKVRDGADWKKQ